MQVAYHCREPVGHTYNRWTTRPRLKLECDPEKEQQRLIFTNFGFLQTCHNILLESTHTAKIHFARGDDVGTMHARFYHINSQTQS